MMVEERFQVEDGAETAKCIVVFFNCPDDMEGSLADEKCGEADAIREISCERRVEVVIGALVGACLEKSMPLYHLWIDHENE